MEALSVNFLIEDSPTPVAILDSNLCFINHSKIWLEEFCPKSSSIIGNSYFEVLPHTPEDLKKTLASCLKGSSDLNQGKRLIGSDGISHWFKWKINPWKDANGAVGGLIIFLEDISDFKRREELLLKAEEVARIGGWEVDMVANTVHWTDVTKSIHETPMDYVPNLEEGINFYKEGEHRDEIMRLVSEAIQNGTSWDTELIIITAKNRELWVRAKGEVEMVDGKCLRIYGTFQDIDAAKRTHLEYLKVSERLSIATEEANIGIFDYDVIKNILVWDDNMYDIYGVRKDAFSGGFEAWQSGLLPEDKPQAITEFELALSGKKEFDTSFRIVWPNGEIRHIRAIAVTQRDANGKAIKMIGTNWDITELKATQQQLLRSKESFEETFKNSAIGLAIVNLDGTFREVNTSFCNSVGYTEEEICGLSIKAITHPEDIKKDMDLLNKVIDRKQDSYQIEKRYIHKSGHIIHVILTVTAEKNIEGGLSCFIAQVIDITNRKKNEDTLTKYVDVTKEQNDSLLNFAHIVSHNLRSHSSNLSMLSGFLNSEEDEKERQKLFAMLDDASESLHETVMHLNEVVQVKVGAPEKMKSINLYNAIRSVEKNLSQLLHEKNAVCHVNVIQKQKISAIPAYLDSILLNLFTNSIKYSDPERSPVITIDSIEEDGILRLTFKDNGMGIDLARHGSKLFGMYKTFHRNKDAKGIGLFITKNQIEAMGGTIEVESTVGVGTIFTLHFKLGYK